jgi:hypothetical protein
MNDAIRKPLKKRLSLLKPLLMLHESHYAGHGNDSQCGAARKAFGTDGTVRLKLL